MQEGNIIDTLCKHIYLKNLEINMKDKTERDLRRVLEAKDGKIASLEERVDIQFKQIQELQDEVDKYANIKETSEEVGKVMRKIRGKND